MSDETRAYQGQAAGQPKPMGWMISEIYAIVKGMTEPKLTVGEVAQRDAWTRREDTESLMEPLKERIQELQAKLAETAHLPNLGLASTEQMMRELISRWKMTQYDPTQVPIDVVNATERALVLAEMLGGMSAPEREYRTVDHG